MIRDLAVCDKFTTKLLSLDGEFTIYSENSFISLITLDGNISFKWNEGELKAQKSDSIFIPAGLEIELNGTADTLYSNV